MREWTRPSYLCILMYYCCLCQYIGYGYSLLLANFFDFFPSKRIPSKKNASPDAGNARWTTGGVAFRWFLS